MLRNRVPSPGALDAAVLLLAAVFAWRVWGTPVVILAAAIAPAAVYAALIAFADRRKAGPPSILVATFLWGAVFAAWIATSVNTRVIAHGELRFFDPVVAVPVVEELAKAVALLLVVVARPRDVCGVREGIVYGALVGLGFAASENVLYLTLAALQGGYVGLFQSAYLRGFLYGLNHAVFAATTGAAFGHACAMRSRGRALALALAGCCAAVAQHVAWNAVASRTLVDVLCDPRVAGEACRVPTSPWHLYVTAPAIVALFIGPGVAVLVAAARWHRPLSRNG